MHKRGSIVGKKFGGIDAFRFVTLSCPAQVDGETGEVFRVLSNLESITGMVSGEIRNQDQRLSRSLLVIVDGDVVAFDFRHRGISVSGLRFLPLKGFSDKRKLHTGSCNFQRTETTDQSGTGNFGALMGLKLARC